MYVILRDADNRRFGKFVGAVGLTKYGGTNFLHLARVYKTRERAEADRCDGEIVAPLDGFLKRLIDY